MIQGGNVHAARVALTQFIRPLRSGLELGIRTFQRHPFLVKTVSSGIGFAVGDSLTQLATRREEEPYDWTRTGLMGAAGLATAGPLGYLFIVWMEANIMPHAATSRLAITTKVTLDQVLGSIFWQAALLTIHEPYRLAARDMLCRTSRRLQKRFEKAAGNRVAIVG